MEERIYERSNESKFHSCKTIFVYMVLVLSVHYVIFVQNKKNVITFTFQIPHKTYTHKLSRNFFPVVQYSW
jgi:hypothetical protein